MAHTPKTLRTVHDLTREFDSLEKEGVDAVVLDMLRPENRVAIGGRYTFTDADVLVVYITYPRE